MNVPRDDGGRLPFAAEHVVHLHLGTDRMCVGTGCDRGHGERAGQVAERLVSQARLVGRAGPLTRARRVDGVAGADGLGAVLVPDVLVVTALSPALALVDEFAEVGVLDVVGHWRGSPSAGGDQRAQLEVRGLHASPP